MRAKDVSASDICLSRVCQERCHEVTKWEQSISPWERCHKVTKWEQSISPWERCHEVTERVLLTLILKTPSPVLTGHPPQRGGRLLTLSKNF